MSRPLRIGLMMDEPFVDHSTRDFIASCRQQPTLALTHLVLHPIPAAPRQSPLRRLQTWVGRRGWRALFGKIVFHALRIAEARVLGRLVPAQFNDERFDARDQGLQVITITPQVSASGFVYRFSTEDLQALRACDFDVLLRFGSGILRGEILGLPRFGILSFHHGDNRFNRGGPPGYWEVLHQRDATGFIIQRLTEELDGGEVLSRGWIQTRSPFLRNLEHLNHEALPALKRLLLALARDRQLPAAEPSLPYAWPLLRSPGVLDSLHYVAGQSLHWGRKLARRVAGRRYRWSVAVQPRPWREAVLWRATVVPNRPGHFLADPFVVTHEGQTCLFVEDYDYATGKGLIAAYRLSAEGARQGQIGKVSIEALGTALEEPFHLSFPYLFRHGGQLYLCPETQQVREIRVYRCVEFPLRWELASVLVHDIDAVDTMVFPHGDRWWLLTNLPPAGIRDYGADCFSELHAFHGLNPLGQDWTPHPANPLLSDSTRARNAGLLRDDAGLYRVSQRYGFDQYGVNVTLSELARLDEDEYVERPIARLSPAFNRHAVGLHHVHSDGDWTVFDFARYERG